MSIAALSLWPSALLTVLRASEPAYRSQESASPDHPLLPQGSDRGQWDKYLEHESNRTPKVQEVSFISGRFIEAH